MREEISNAKETGVVLSSGNSSLESQTILSLSLVNKVANEPTGLMDEQEHNESPNIPIYNSSKSKSKRLMQIIYVR